MGLKTVTFLVIHLDWLGLRGSMEERARPKAFFGNSTLLI